MNRSLAEIEFSNQLKMCEIGGWQEEYRFHEVRQWKFDFAFPAKKVAVEIEGGTWTDESRHTRGSGFEKDCEKYGEAAVMGWRLIRVPTGWVKDGRALDLLERALEATK